MSKLTTFIKSFSGIVTLGVILCGLADVYLSFMNEIHSNPHLFKTYGRYLKTIFYELIFVLPIALYTIGQFIMLGKIWANILGIICIFITSTITFNVHFIGGDPSMGMLIGINMICYWIVGSITFFGSLFYLGKNA